MHSVFTAQRRSNCGCADGDSVSATQAVADAGRLAEAVGGLAHAQPELSAATGLWALAAARAGAVAGTASASAAALAPETTLIALAGHHGHALPVRRRAAHGGAVAARPSIAEAAAPAAATPTHRCRSTRCWCRCFARPASSPTCWRSLRALDYPADRLEIMLIVEASTARRRAALALRHARCAHAACSSFPTASRAPSRAPSSTRLQFARGDYVVVYDAEDAPEPDQLRRALAALSAGGGSLGCLQAQLNIYNSDATWFTRQFTVEYTALFDCILPTLERLRLPVPLGGTSNHFPRAVLECRRRLGSLQRHRGRRPRHPPGAQRLARRRAVARRPGRRRRRRFRIWKGQRTRWLKGWMQTYLVHMRRPRRLWRELGAAALPRLPGADGRHDPVGAGAPVVLPAARLRPLARPPARRARQRVRPMAARHRHRQSRSPAT